MSKYKIGKDIGRLMARVEALEKKARCSCEDRTGGGGERTIRRATEEEQQQAAQARAPMYCIYFVGGFNGPPCPGIAIGDFICVSPCPPCPDVNQLRIVDAQGKTVCILNVRWGAAGHCSDCPPDSPKFIWV